MKLILGIVTATALVFGQPTSNPRIQTDVIDVPGHGQMGYTIAIPRDLTDDNPRPLVLALHPGGGSRGGPFLSQVVAPALRDWNAIIVAPDSPNRRWSVKSAEESVLFLLDEIFSRYPIDQNQRLVTGFSMGGSGTWFMATHHPDRFDGAIPIASAPRENPLTQLGAMPVYIIHSADDERVPVGPAREAAAFLEDRDHPVGYTELTRIGHYAMGGYVGALKTAGEWMKQQWNK